MALEIDLVRALREPEYREEISDELESDITSDVMFEAADEIARLRAEMEKAREIIRDFLPTLDDAVVAALSENVAACYKMEAARAHAWLENHADLQLIREGRADPGEVSWEDLQKAMREDEEKRDA